jgi:hypothetical protein
MANVKTRIYHRADSAANWTGAQSDAGSTPVLDAGEIGYITSGTGAGKFKVGDGTTLWGALPYAPAGLADLATKATNVVGGATGSLVYQSTTDSSTTLAIGAQGKSLVVSGSNLPAWSFLDLGTTYFNATTSTAAGLNGIMASTDVTGTTGSYKLVFNNQPSLTLPAIGSGGATFAGSSSGTVTVKSVAAASGTVLLPAPGSGVTENLVTAETVATNYLSKTSSTGQSVAADVTLASGKTLTAPTITATGTLTAGSINGIVRATSGALAGGGIVALGSEVTGTLPLTNGGTGATTASAARQNLRIFVQSTEPSSPVEGDIWFW